MPKTDCVALALSGLFFCMSRQIGMPEPTMGASAGIVNVKSRNLTGFPVSALSVRECVSEVDTIKEHIHTHTRLRTPTQMCCLHSLVF